MHLFRSLSLVGWVVAAASPLAAAAVESATDDASAATKVAVEKSEIIRCDSDQSEPEINARPPFCGRDFERLPLTSNPWAVLELSPGVLLDRVNVGGIEDGTQPVFLLVGSEPDNSSWVFEGLDITDLGAVGATPTFFDVGALDTTVVTSGGPDAALAGAGPTIDLTQGRGGASWRGSARVLVAEGDWQDGGERLEAVSEVGAEVGGPVITDRLFAWAAFGREEIERLSLDGVPEDIELEMASIKLNANLTDSTALVLFGNRAEKTATAGAPAPPAHRRPPGDKAGRRTSPRSSSLNRSASASLSTCWPARWKAVSTSTPRAATRSTPCSARTECGATAFSSTQPTATATNSRPTEVFFGAATGPMSSASVPVTETSRCARPPAGRVMV